MRVLDKCITLYSLHEVPLMDAVLRKPSRDALTSRQIDRAKTDNL